MDHEPIKPERWQEIKRLCHSALERAPSERAGFLEQACVGDGELRREVEALLAHEEQAKAEHFIEKPALVVAAQQLAGEPAMIAPGSTLGPYQIISVLGKGGMGEVYRARDTRIGREVAIKVLPEIYAADPDRWRRFEQEARVAGILNHPNIITIYDIGTHEGSPLIVFELLEGETLRARLSAAAPSPLPPDTAVDYALQIARGLAAAHKKNIVHRDLKPENLLITEDGRVKILDFGLAKLTQPSVALEALNSAGADTGLTSAGVIMGTAAYMAPEQVRGQTADHRADIFAFGAVLYEMLAGQQPFRAASAFEIMNAILKEEPPTLAQINSSITPALQRVISRCLAKSPEARYQSVQDVVFDLESLPKSSSASEPVSARRAPHRSTRLAWIGAALGVLAAIAPVLWWQSKDRPPPASPQQTLVSMFPGSHRAASFSPDGSMIAFLNSVDGVPQVWVKNLAQGEPKQITFGEVSAHHPRWSPANDQIVFAVGRTDTPPQLTSHTIWSVPVLGGVPRKIIEDGSNPNWSPDGTRLVFERRDQIWTARADGGDPKRLEGVPSIDHLGAVRAPCFSPDGLQIAFFQPEHGPKGDLWVIPSAGGQARRLTFDSTMGGSPVWMPDGRFIVYSSQRAGSLTLWRIRSSGGSPEPVLVSAGDDTDPEISRDGRKLIYMTTRNTFALTMLDPSTGGARELTQAREMIVAPSFSPAGDKIAFFGHVSHGAIHVFTIESNGRNLTPVTRGEGERNTWPQWSQDGRALYFYQERPVTSFRRISVEGGQSSEVVAGWTWETHNGARVDPTGDRVVYTRQVSGVLAATLTRDLRSGEEMPLSVPLWHQRWSRDGRFLAGVDATSGRTRAGRIVICPVGGGPCREVGKGYGPVWSYDDRRVFFLRSVASGEQAELWSVAREGGDERRTAAVLQMHPIGPIFDVSRSGEVVYVQFKPGRPELWLTDLGSR
jgi:serine/threonine protein kinase